MRINKITLTRYQKRCVFVCSLVGTGKLYFTYFTLSIVYIHFIHYL
nr:MAG TPA: hypothetical protein [Caudoviricetes sp.]